MVNILGSLLHQLLITVPEPIADEVIKKLEDIQSLRGKLETRDALALLKIRLHQLKQAFICIDAVDELEPKVRQQLLNILKELVTDYNTHLFLTGRVHIECEVQKFFDVELRYSVTISASQQDIEKYLEQQIMEDLNPDAMDRVLAEEIADAILKQSQGM